MFTKTLAILLLPALAAAQYGYAPSTPSGSGGSTTASASALPAAPSAPANTPGHVNIDVFFQGNYVFNPPNITASAGTLVTFYFPNTGTNHSVTQSTFADPCTWFFSPLSPLNAAAGFDSGLSSLSTFTINITDTNPIYYFCKQVLHCGMGMVGSINAPLTGNNTYAQYLANAKAIGSNESITPDNGPVAAGVHATATGPPVPDGSGSTTHSSGGMKVTTSIGFTLFAAVLGVAMA